MFVMRSKLQCMIRYHDRIFTASDVVADSHCVYEEFREKCHEWDVITKYTLKFTLDSHCKLPITMFKVLRQC